jgi:hypothetical protein
MLSFSSPKKNPNRIFVTLDGKDGVLFKRLIRVLGSEKRAQNAVILEGFIARLRATDQISQKEIAIVEKRWKTLTGYTKGDFDSLMKQVLAES